MVDGLEISVVSKVSCFADLGPITVGFTFYILDCNLPYILSILFFRR